MARTVCVDGSFLDRRYLGTGVHSYSVNILRQMAEITEGEPMGIHVLVPSFDQINGTGLVPRQGFELVPSPARRPQTLWRLARLIVAAKRMRPDALFLPFPVLIPFKPAALAVTVHDIIPLLFPRQYNHLRGRLFRLSYTSSLRSADLIFTDSEHSKADIVSVVRIPAERIVVATLGYDSDTFRPAPPKPQEREAVLGRYGITRPYILHVGTMEPRKNMVRLVQAYRLLIERRKDFPFQLVLGGSVGGGCEDLLQLVREPGLQGMVILPGVVANQDLAELYRSATCFAMPSLYEGFGLPLLEAMACGVPAMSSSRSSLPEVGGDSVLYFDPESVEEMSATLERLLNDTLLRKQLAEHSLQRAKQFSWERCARTTLRALRAL